MGGDDMSWRQCSHCVAGTCGLAIANRKTRGNYRGHRFYKVPIPWSQVVTWSDSMKKPSSAGGPSGGGEAQLCDLGIRFENLWAFMTDTTWDDGTKRCPGTLLVMWEEGQWKVMLNDKALQRLAFVTGATWEDVVSKADLAVRDDSADWRKAKVWKK